MKRSTLLRCLPLLLLMLASCSTDPTAQAKRYVEQGNKFYARAKYPEAAIMYKKALNKDRKFGEAYYRLGLTDLKLGNIGEALAMLRIVVDELQQDNIDAKIQEANIYVFAAAQGGPQTKSFLEEATKLVEKVLGQDSKSFDGHRLAGQIALLYKNSKKAVEELQLADQLKPNQSRSRAGVLPRR